MRRPRLLAIRNLLLRRLAGGSTVLMNCTFYGAVDIQDRRPSLIEGCEFNQAPALNLRGPR